MLRSVEYGLDQPSPTRPPGMANERWNIQSRLLLNFPLVRKYVNQPTDPHQFFRLMHTTPPSLPELLHIQFMSMSVQSFALTKPGK